MWKIQSSVFMVCLLVALPGPVDARSYEGKTDDEILASAGADFSNPVQLTIFAVNYQAPDRAILVGVRDRYFDTVQPPASTLLGVQALARPEFMIEIEATAIIDSG